MENRKSNIFIGAMTAVIGIGSLAWFVKNKFMPKVSIKDYKEICMEFAIIDDEICRNELEGNTIYGKKIVFDSKGATVQYRYKLFREIYLKYTREMLEEERKRLYTRLAKSKQYANMQIKELELEFQK